ncbi:MAG TPA: SMR family transporter [Methylibium sp.]|uniref:DMT family transporter n=1 Tax=Methylibium sp. TaxID=2067992 RepID=UPI002DBDD34C|nr:SMR family transporter [Methylibium sp.]HEU4459240.1 SMR family transporter [Methylibium sp.]
MNRTTLGLILVSVAMSSGAQVLLKTGMGHRKATASESVNALMHGVLNAAFSPWVLGGLALYFASTVVWLAVLSRTPVSTAYPFVGLGFVMTMLLGWALLHESLSPAKLVGTLLVVAGVALIAQGG